MTALARLTLDDLWRHAAPGGESFDPRTIAHLPDGVRRYLEHAIAPGTPLASAVRLAMEGSIKLGGKWVPFTAEQVIRWDRGFLWSARTAGLPPIRGWDRFVDGAGAMRWKLFGLVPVMTAAGPDVTRSAAARFHAETTWLPSALLAPAVQWSAGDAARLRAQVKAGGHVTDVALTIDGDGRLLTTALSRWGNPDGGTFQELPFGAIAEEESTFEGYTVPTKLRAGWHFGTPRFEAEGEFWRASVTSATYR